ncbi:MAG: ribosome biogenesis GTPase Der [Microthrixaceae bacterium]
MAEELVDPAAPRVAIVGRPNVGKSTLLNRILGRRLAIVEEKPGVTRDRLAVPAAWRGRSFTVVDTGGWLAGGSVLDRKVSAQSEAALADADAIVLLVDATVGVTEEDARVSQLLLGDERPVLLVANKVDDTAHEAAIWDLLSLGLGEPIAVSALHGRGTGDMLDRLVDELDATGAFAEAEAAVSADAEAQEPTAANELEPRVSVALVGRPNVGKSTLFNRLIGEDRAVVHDMAGTTRDSVDTVVETEAGRIRFVDTAGMRRKSRVDEDTEYFSSVRALRSIDTADVALLIVDATEGITHQDQRLAERVDGAGCPVVVVLNKWELLDAEARAQLDAQVERKLHFLGSPSVLKVSALTGKGVNKLMPALSGSIDAYRTRIPTREVNQTLRRAQQSQPAPHGGRVLYATQGATDPPTFTLFTNKELPASYLRYLERSLREGFDLGATPIKLRVRRRG